REARDQIPLTVREGARVGREHGAEAARERVVALGRREAPLVEAAEIAAEERAYVRAEHRDRERVPARARAEPFQGSGLGANAPAREEPCRVLQRERSRVDGADTGVRPGGEVDEFEARGDERAGVAEATRDRREEAAEQGVVELTVGACVEALGLDGL